jgi:eukaryotic-like serine/threonine-protein kinase
MTIAAGTRFGQYEIVTLLGAGGMGEVYRARDSRLGRDVAIKVLPESVARDSDRLARFEREARVLATLNHPHVGAIYGVEDTGSAIALVLELVEGETLAGKLEGLKGKGLGISQSLSLASQISNALDAAHERGIVHRDLKPANIKVTPDGRIKVLDFGLARSEGAGQEATPGSDAANAQLTHSPTMMAPTMEGVLLGTAPYMSPEQARGKVVDKRADIWAFGCVLYEMLTGRLAFPGETTSDTIVAILDREPAWSALPAETPVNLRLLLQRCLEKDPRRRLRDIGDASIVLDAPGAALPNGTVGDVRPFSGRAALWIVVGALMTSAAFGVWAFVLRRDAATALSVRHQRLTDFVGMEEFPAISPDGKTVAFTSPVRGRRQIWIRLLAGGAPLQITTDDADHQEPRWTPDSSALVYYTPPGVVEGTLWEVPALGGSPRRIASAVGGGDVSPDGQRLALVQMQHDRPALSIVGRNGGDVTAIPLPADDFFESPRWSPDGNMVALQRNSGADFDKRVYVVPLSGGDGRDIAHADDMKGLAWLPDGSGLVFSSSRGSTVLYPPTFNLRAVNRDGTRERQLTFGDLSYEQPDVGRSGAVLASRIRMQSDIWKVPFDVAPADAVRSAVRITHQTGAVQTPALNPDGSRLVYLSDSGGHGNLWVMNTDGTGTARQLTFERDPLSAIGVPVWAPAGDRIAFIYSREGRTALWVVGSDGSAAHELVPRGSWACWSPDGKWLYYQPSRSGPMCIEKIPAGGGTPVSVRCDNAGAPAVSDGGALYYASALTAGLGAWTDWEIRVAAPENGSARALVRIAVGRVPIQALFFHMFLSPDRRWLALPLSDGGTSNIWVIPTDGTAARAVTDFGDRAVVIARRVSWSPDGRSIYAAVADIDADIVLLSGLIR